MSEIYYKGVGWFAVVGPARPGRGERVGGQKKVTAAAGGTATRKTTGTARLEEGISCNQYLCM